MRKIKMLSLAFFFCSCVQQQRLSLKPQTKIQTLYVDLQMNPAIPEFIHLEFDRQLNDFVTSYNLKSHLFKLERKNSNLTNLQIRVQGVDMVTPQEQATGVVVSLIGFSLPFVMAAAKTRFVFAFWYFPRARSLSELKLSDDVGTVPGKSIQHIVTSPGFLKSPAKQVKKHGIYFNRYLSSLMKDLERSTYKR